MGWGVARVFPVPAPASTRGARGGAAAPSRCSGSSDLSRSSACIGNVLRPGGVVFVTSVDAREDNRDRPSPSGITARADHQLLHDVHRPLVWLLPPPPGPAGP